MARLPLTTHPVHGSDSGLVTAVNADLALFNNADGYSLVPTGNQTIYVFNPAGGAASHVSVPSSDDPQHRTTNVAHRVRIPAGTGTPLPKFKRAGWAQGPEGIHVNVDDTIHAEGTLTLASNPIEADTFTLGVRPYTFTAVPAAAGDIPLTADIAHALAAAAAAINGTDGLADPNPDVAATPPGTTTLIVEAIVGGSGGNSIVSTSAFDDGGNTFDAATLGTTQSGAAGSARLRYLVAVDPTD